MSWTTLDCKGRPLEQLLLGEKQPDSPEGYQRFIKGKHLHEVAARSYKGKREFYAVVRSRVSAGEEEFGPWTLTIFRLSWHGGLLSYYITGEGYGAPDSPSETVLRTAEALIPLTPLTEAEQQTFEQAKAEEQQALQRRDHAATKAAQQRMHEIDPQAGRRAWRRGCHSKREQARFLPKVGDIVQFHAYLIPEQRGDTIQLQLDYAEMKGTRQVFRDPQNPQRSYRISGWKHKVFTVVDSRPAYMQQQRAAPQ